MFDPQVNIGKDLFQLNHGLLMSCVVRTLLRAEAKQHGGILKRMYQEGAQ